MREAFVHALTDTAGMIPFLLVIYALVEWLETRVGDSVQATILRAGKAGPAAGAVLGCIPQCGFSVMAGSLYARRLITTGSLLAVYLSTSDEAVPVILAQPGKTGLVVPLLVTKVLVALVAGYGVDLALRSSLRPAAEAVPDGRAEEHQVGCCDHHVSGDVPLRERLLHPLIHTAKVLVFVFVVTLCINTIIWRVGQANLGPLLLQHSVLQPIVTGVVGLIPNCAASVAITQVFLSGGISFGSALSGLCSASGLGLLVLVRENRSHKDTARVLALLLGISIAVGIIAQSVYG